MTNRWSWCSSSISNGSGPLLWVPVRVKTEPSATNLVSVRNTRVFLPALTALTEPRALWQRIKQDPSLKRQVVSHTYHAVAIIPFLLFLQCVVLYITLWTITLSKEIVALVSQFIHFASGMLWRIRTIGTSRVFHSSHGLQLCCTWYPTPSTIYAILRMSATFYLSAIAISQMPHSPIYV